MHGNLVGGQPAPRCTHLTTWPPALWPPALILEMAQYLDETSLLALGATCKQLNSLAASVYYDEQQLSSSYFHLCGTPSKRQPLYAARLFFQAPRITRLTFVVQPGIQQFKSDIEELVRLLNHTVALERFELNLGDIDAMMDKTGLEVRSQNGQDAPEVPADLKGAKMARLLAGIVDAVERAGCRDLSIIGGHGFFHMMHMIGRASDTRSRAQGAYHSCHSFRCYSPP